MKPYALTAAFARTPRTEALFDGRVQSDLLALRLEPFATIHRAFRPMVRELRFDVSEMAIATFLQARAMGRPLVLLPVVLAARFQQSALLCRTDSAIAGPADLKGRRVGVRAYSQTTGMWLRGILGDEYGVAPDSIAWTTFEDAHVAGIADPPFCRRAPAGADMVAMLRAGELDAIIVGTELPEGGDLRTVFPDPAASADTFWQRHGFVPVNHMAVVRSDVALAHPDWVTEIVRMLAEVRAAMPPSADGRDPYPAGRAALAPAIALAVRTMEAQGMLPAPVDPAAVWEGLPASVE